MLPAGEAQKTRSAPSSGTALSAEAMGILHMMIRWGSSSLRLIVPVGDQGLRLIVDPRFPSGRFDNGPFPLLSKAPALELIRRGLISALSENGDNNKIGWREMFKGHEEQIPEGAQVYCVTQ